MIKLIFTISDVAKAAGVSVHTARDHAANGALPLCDLLGTAKYIIAHRLVGDIQCQSEKPKTDAEAPKPEEGHGQ